MSTRPTNTRYPRAADLVRLSAMLALNYVRYLVLSPMFVLWGYALAMLGAIVIVNQSDSLLDLVRQAGDWIATLPVIGDAFVAKIGSLADEEGVIRLGGKDLEGVVLKAWGLLSLAGLVISLLVTWVFGPFEPWSLKRKLKTLALGCGMYWLVLAAAYALDPSEFNGSAGSWLLMFLGVSLLVFVWSAPFLTIAHVLGHLVRWQGDPAMVGSGMERKAGAAGIDGDA